MAWREGDTQFVYTYGLKEHSSLIDQAIVIACQSQVTKGLSWEEQSGRQNRSYTNKTNLQKCKQKLSHASHYLQFHRGF